MPTGVKTVRANAGRRGRPQKETASTAEALPAKTTDGDDDRAVSFAVDDVDDIPVCFICAEPVRFWSVAECNHRTCHVCALRLRALYKRSECTFCKHAQSSLVFTSSPSRPFNDYGPQEVPFKDAKLAILFETQEMMEDTLILLRFNCPDPKCDMIAGGWNDLKMHVRAQHGRQLCDLCIRHKKVFAHEHILYTHSQLSIHLPSYARRSVHASQGKAKEKPESTENGVHPFCEFCKEAFFDDDELYAHMRERHEECFVCKRIGLPHLYFEDYQRLERHFTDAHFPCTHPTCLSQKFVVFGSKLDLQGHAIDAHGDDMSSRARKDARRVIGVEFEQATRPMPARQQRLENQLTSDPSQTQPSDRRSAFGTSLTGPVIFPNVNALSNTNSTSQDRPPFASGDTIFVVTNAEPAVLQRHATFIARVHALSSGSSSAYTSIRAAIRSYRASESGARDLISTVFTVLNQDLDSTASIINLSVDLLDDEEKRNALLAAWNGFKIEQRRLFPDLGPTSTGSSYAGISSGRVLNIKGSTAAQTPSQSTRAMLDRVAHAASGSTSNVNANSHSNPLAVPPTGIQQSGRGTPWTKGNTSVSTTPNVFSLPGPGSGKLRTPHLSASAFPTLPQASSTTALEARQLVNSSNHHQQSTTSAWNRGLTTAVTPAESDIDREQNDETGGDSRTRKKKKGKEKQTLFSFGTFATGSQ